MIVLKVFIYDMGLLSLIIMGFWDWVKVGRIHTACLTMAITLMGYVYAGGSDVLTGFLWLLFGLGWHYFGFLQNNVFDYKYDKMDPNKQHFPLVSGRVSYRSAFIVAHAGLALLFVYGSILVGNGLGIMLIVIGYISGMVYNYYSKQIIWKPIPIAVCFSVLPLISYVSVGMSPSYEALLLWLFVFMTMLFQIGYSGELKDIDRQENNILRKIGSEIGVSLYAIILKAGNLLVGVLILDAVGIASPEVLIAPFLLMLLISIVLERQINDYIKWSQGVWDRDAALKNMSFMEVLTYWFLVAVSADILGRIYTVGWFFLPVVWFFLWNKAYWGTVSYPKV